MDLFRILLGKDHDRGKGVLVTDMEFISKWLCG